MSSSIFRRHLKQHRLLFELLVSPLKSCIQLLLWVESLYPPLSIVRRNNIIVNTTVDIFCLFFFHTAELSNFRIPRISVHEK